MRVIEFPQPTLGRIAIEDIEFDPYCRDDITNTLRGIPHIYCTPELREPVFALLTSEILASPTDSSDDDASGESAGINPDTGRPGMELWKILVMGLLKQGLDCDYDRIGNLADHHAQVRAMLGDDDTGDKVRYDRRTITRNVNLLTPSLLGKIDKVVVDAGHVLAGYAEGEKLQARCDSFVVETDVHYPTDVNLLWDSLRCLIRDIALLCAFYGLQGWRQSQHLTNDVRRAFDRVRSAKQRTKKVERVSEYLDVAADIVERAEGSLEKLEKAGAEAGDLNKVKGYLEHAKRQMDQVDRRLGGGGDPARREGVFDIPRVHALVREGEAGDPSGIRGAGERGGERASIRDELPRHVGGVGRGCGSAVDRGHAGGIPGLEELQLRQGVSQPGARAALQRLLELVAMPRKGKLSKAAKEEESEAEFVAARRAHAAVEAGIRNLEKHGLGRVMSRSKTGSERMVGLSVVATNVHRIGMLLQRAERERLRRQRLKRAA